MATKQSAGAGGVQVVRIETRTTLDGGLVSHIEGDIRPDAVRKVPDGERSVVRLAGDIEAARRAIDTAMAKRAARGRRAGRRPAEAIEMVFQGAGRYGPGEDGIDRSWDRPREAKFEADCLNWARRIAGGESVIAAAYAHRDELTHHVHILLVPIRDGDLGWCKVRDAAVDRIAATRGKPRSKRQRRYSVIQDDFHVEVGQKFELERGERNSGKKHQAINRQIAADEHARQAEAHAAHLDARLAFMRAEKEKLDRDISMGTTGRLSSRAKAGKKIRLELQDRARGAEAAVAAVSGERDSAQEQVKTLTSTVETVVEERDAALTRIGTLEQTIELFELADGAVSEADPPPSVVQKAVRDAEKRILRMLAPAVEFVARRAGVESTEQVMRLLAALRFSEKDEVSSVCAHLAKMGGGVSAPAADRGGMQRV